MNDKLGVGLLVSVTLILVCVLVLANAKAINDTPAVLKERNPIIDEYILDRMKGGATLEYFPEELQVYAMTYLTEEVVDYMRLRNILVNERI